jgi:hypothetical protein
MIRSTCFDKAFADSVTGPVSCTEFLRAIYDFGTLYTANNLNYRPVRIDLSITANAALFDTIRAMASEGEFGLIFHYGYDSGDLVYLMSKGKIDQYGKFDYCPFKAEENGQLVDKYALLDHSNSVQYVDANRFDGLVNAYRDNMLLNQNGNQVALDPGQNPMRVYHSPDEFVQFYNQYASGTNDHLYINHAAKMVPLLKYPGHAPVFVMGDDTAFYRLSDTPGLDRYQERGLNLGHLCPPMCGTQTPGTCP